MGPVLQVELVQYVPQMILHRALTDGENRSDLFVGLYFVGNYMLALSLALSYWMSTVFDLNEVPSLMMVPNLGG